MCIFVKEIKMWYSRKFLKTLSIIAEDKDVRIVYRSINIDKAFDFADLMNQYNS